MIVDVKIENGSWDPDRVLLRGSFSSIR